MLNFVIKLLAGNSEFIEIISKCPYCGHRVAFYYCVPKRCNICGRELPDFGSILGDIKERLEYHKCGKAAKRLGAFKYFIRKVKDEFCKSKTAKR